MTTNVNYYSYISNTDFYIKKTAYSIISLWSFKRSKKKDLKKKDLKKKKIFLQQLAFSKVYKYDPFNRRALRSTWSASHRKCPFINVLVQFLFLVFARYTLQRHSSNFLHCIDRQTAKWICIMFFFPIWSKRGVCFSPLLKKKAELLPDRAM